MWSHYGGMHSQVCFEIDFSKTNLGYPSKVTYSDELVKKRNALNPELKKELGCFIVTNKFKIWDYEKEVRLIVDVLEPETDFTDFLPIEDVKFLSVKFDLDSITKVIFGIKSEKTEEQKTIKMFEMRKLKPGFEKMYIDPETLKLESKEYNY